MSASYETPPIRTIVSQNDYERKADNSDGEGKNRPVATNFQFLKILAPLGQLLVGACGAPNPAVEVATNQELSNRTCDFF
jgi:hypothetical protein